MRCVALCAWLREAPSRRSAARGPRRGAHDVRERWLASSSEVSDIFGSGDDDWVALAATPESFGPESLAALSDWVALASHGDLQSGSDAGNDCQPEHDHSDVGGDVVADDQPMACGDVVTEFADGQSQLVFALSLRALIDELQAIIRLQSRRIGAAVIGAESCEMPTHDARLVCGDPPPELGLVAPPLGEAGLDVREDPLGAQASAAQTSVCIADALARFADVVGRFGRHFQNDAQGQAITRFDTSTPNVSLASGSVTFQAGRLNVSRDKLRHTRGLHACAAVLIQYADLRSVLSAIISDCRRRGGRLVTFTTSVRYDETPMKLVVLDADNTWGLPSECFDTAKVSKDAWALIQERVRDSAPTKLLQTEYVLTALIWLPQPNQHVLFTFLVVSPVQPMARATSNVYLAALARSEGMMAFDVLKKNFSRAQRLSSTDGDGAIARAERARMARCDEACLRTTCVLHKLCAIRESVCNLSSSLLTKIKHVVLRLQLGGHMKLFRAAFRRVVLSRLVIIRDRPPSPMFLRRNLDALKLSMPDSIGVRSKRMTILALLNGDWADTSCVQHHASLDEDDETIKSMFVGPLAAAMVGNGASFVPQQELRARRGLVAVSRHNGVRPRPVFLDV